MTILYSIRQTYGNKPLPVLYAWRTNEHESLNFVNKDEAMILAKGKSNLRLESIAPTVSKDVSHIPFWKARNVIHVGARIEALHWSDVIALPHHPRYMFADDLLSKDTYLTKSVGDTSKFILYVNVDFPKDKVHFVHPIDSNEAEWLQSIHVNVD